MATSRFFMVAALLAAAGLACGVFGPQLKPTADALQYEFGDAADPGFPNPQLSEDAAKGVVFGFVFDNSWINTLKGNDAPPAPALASRRTAAFGCACCGTWRSICSHRIGLAPRGTSFAS